MSSTPDLSSAMRHELRNPVIGVLAIILYGGSAALLLLFWFTDVRSDLAPFVGQGIPIVLVIFTVAIGFRARKRMRKRPQALTSGTDNETPGAHFGRRGSSVC
ncbi:hypothetical protein [Agreia sp. COWG]|uniref:hypothetical protein n=1 Tax=Agreia sp. COWG TaxID=2773266 RepID=UPI00192919CC|nr:hypothetical protein [Agreia sp. COWG]